MGQLVLVRPEKHMFMAATVCFTVHTARVIGKFPQCNDN